MLLEAVVFNNKSPTSTCTLCVYQLPPPVAELLIHHLEHPEFKKFFVLAGTMTMPLMIELRRQKQPDLGRFQASLVLYSKLY